VATGRVLVVVVWLNAGGARRCVLARASRLPEPSDRRELAFFEG